MKAVYYNGYVWSISNRKRIKKIQTISCVWLIAWTRQTIAINQSECAKAKPLIAQNWNTEKHKNQSKRRGTGWRPSCERLPRTEWTRWTACHIASQRRWRRYHQNWCSRSTGFLDERTKTIRRYWQRSSVSKLVWSGVTARRGLNEHCAHERNMHSLGESHESALTQITAHSTSLARLNSGWDPIWVSSIHDIYFHVLTQFIGLENDSGGVWIFRHAGSTDTHALTRKEKRKDEIYVESIHPWLYFITVYGVSKMSGLYSTPPCRLLHTHRATVAAKDGHRIAKGTHRAMDTRKDTNRPTAAGKDAQRATDSAKATKQPKKTTERQIQPKTPTELRM